MLLFCTARTLTAFTQASSSMTPAFLYLKRERLKVWYLLDLISIPQHTDQLSHLTKACHPLMLATTPLHYQHMAKWKLRCHLNVTVQYNHFQPLHSHLFWDAAQFHILEFRWAEKLGILVSFWITSDMWGIHVQVCNKVMIFTCTIQYPCKLKAAVWQLSFKFFFTT